MPSHSVFHPVICLPLILLSVLPYPQMATEGTVARCDVNFHTMPIGQQNDWKKFAPGHSTYP